MIPPFLVIKIASELLQMHQKWCKIWSIRQRKNRRIVQNKRLNWIDTILYWTFRILLLHFAIVKLFKG